MKKLSVLMTVAVAVWMMASCGGKTQQVPFDDGDSADIANADPTIYGVCGEGTAMNTLQLLTDTGDTLSIDISDAQDNGKVFGGLLVGDRMAVLPTYQGQDAGCHGDKPGYAVGQLGNAKPDRR